MVFEIRKLGGSNLDQESFFVELDYELMVIRTNDYLTRWRVRDECFGPNMLSYTNQTEHD